MLLKKILCSSCILLIAICSYAQVDKDKAAPVKVISAEELQKLPFSRGINNFTIQQNFSYSRTKPETSDNSTSVIGLNLDYNRFIADGFGVGAGLELSSSRTEVGNDISRINVVKFTGNAIYGHTFDGGLNLYGKASVSVGSSKSKYTSFPTDKADIFGYRFQIGAPIHLYKDGGNYFTPFIRYDHLQYKDEDDNKYIDNKFSLGFQFENYSPCSGYKCDCKNGRGSSANMYNQGRSFINYTPFGEYGFGKSKSDPSGLSNETDVSGGSLDLEYGYYFTKDIALGAGLSWSSSTEDGGSLKYSSSSLSFMPMITLNAPAKDCFENLFLQAGYGFGYSKSKLGSSELKTNITDLSINLGFNHFFGSHIALTPKIGYESLTYKNTDTDVKNRVSGIEFGFGCSLHW